MRAILLKMMTNSIKVVFYGAHPEKIDSEFNLSFRVNSSYNIFYTLIIPKNYSKILMTWNLTVLHSLLYCIIIYSKLNRFLYMSEFCQYSRVIYGTINKFYSFVTDCLDSLQWISSCWYRLLLDLAVLCI